MKKRILSLLTALCLMLTLAPAALAVEEGPDVLTLPNGDTYEIPDLKLAGAEDLTPEDLAIQTVSVDLLAEESEAIPEAGFIGTGSYEDPYKVYTGQGLVNLGATQFNGSELVASYIYLMNDLDMTDVVLDTDYVFYYFAGVIQSDPSLIAAKTPAVIKGLPAGKELIYAWFLGTMGYFDMDLNGQASRLNWLPGKVGGKYLPTSVQNINVYSGGKTANKIPVQINTADATPNYAPFVFTTGGDFTMKNCVNYADITTSSYGSVFYGYYPFDEGGTYTFTNCVNKGTVTMRHAAMFFGNNTPFAAGGANNAYAFHDDVTQNRIQFNNCRNEGKIRGTDSANLFATRAAGVDAISDAYEAYMRSNDMMAEDSVELIGQDLGMKLYSDSEGNLTMTPSTNQNVAYYQVSVYTYVQAYIDNGEDYIHAGTTRYGTYEKLENGSTDISIKKYGVCDYPLGTPGLSAIEGSINGLDVVTYNGKHYYWIDSETLFDSEYYLCVSSIDQADTRAPDLVKLSAYDGSGTLLGTVTDVVKVG